MKSIQTIKVTNNITLQLTKAEFEHLFRLIALADFKALDKETGLMVRFIMEKVYMRFVRRMMAPRPSKINFTIKQAEGVALSQTLNTIDLVAMGDPYGVNLVNRICGFIDQKIA